MDEGSPPKSNEADENPNALSFSVDFNDQPKKPKRRPPKHLSGGRLRKKEVSQASLDEKQRQADERRKKHIEDRLERVRQLEEEAMSLARAMDPIIQASAQAKQGGQPGSVNGLHNPVSVRRRCAESDPVNVRVMSSDLVANSTGKIITDIEAIEKTDDGTSQNSK